MTPILIDPELLFFLCDMHARCAFTWLQGSVNWVYTFDDNERYQGWPWSWYSERVRTPLTHA